MFNFVKTTASLTFGTMSIIDNYNMTLFPTIFALRNTRIYVSFLSGNNMISYIKASVNKTLGFSTIL